jgi:hypothetical protein
LLNGDFLVKSIGVASTYRKDIPTNQDKNQIRARSGRRDVPLSNFLDSYAHHGNTAINIQATRSFQLLNIYLWLIQDQRARAVNSTETSWLHQKMKPSAVRAEAQLSQGNRRRAVARETPSKTFLALKARQ